MERKRTKRITVAAPAPEPPPPGTLRVPGPVLGGFLKTMDCQHHIPALQHVQVRGPILQWTDQYVSARLIVSCTTDGQFIGDQDAEFAAEGSWLLGMARGAGRRGSVDLSASAERVGAATALVGATRYKAQAPNVEGFPALPEPPDGAAWIPLDVADWQKGGAILLVLPYAGTDVRRPHLNALHLGRQVTGCDGHRMSRHTGADMTALDCAVSVHAVQTVLSLVAATAPFRMRAVKSASHVFFLADCQGVSWLVSEKLLDVELPDYAAAESQFDKAAAETLSVDADDLRAFVAIYAKHKGYVAIYPGGELLAWDGDHKSETIGTTLQAMPAGGPLVMFQATLLKPAVAVLPKGGAVTVRIGSAEDGAFIGGELVMPCKPHVHDFALVHLRASLTATGDHYEEAALAAE